MTNKCKYDALAAKNGTGKKDRITELLTVEEGIFGRFFMDTDILSTLYYDIHNQQWPIGDIPCVLQHTTASSWKRAIDKFVKETCDVIQVHYHCRNVKNGRIYPGCLWLHGYIDYAFQLLPDDPHTNCSLAARMMVDATTTVISKQPQAPAEMLPITQPVPEPETMGPNVITKGETIEGREEGAEQDVEEGDKESTILSMIQAYQEAYAPLPAPDTPFQLVLHREKPVGSRVQRLIRWLQRHHCHCHIPSSRDGTIIRDGPVTGASSRHSAQLGMKCAGKCLPDETGGPQSPEGQVQKKPTGSRQGVVRCNGIWRTKEQGGGDQ